MKSLFAKPAYASPDAPENERLPFGRSLAFGVQHVLTMYGGILAVPLIIGNAAGLSPDEIAKMVTGTLFVGGLATILQSAGLPFLGSRLPLVQGVSFAAVATMLAIISGGNGLQDVFGAIIAASVIGFLIAPFFAKIVRFFPPVVTGTVITAIGLTLFPVAANWAMGGDNRLITTDQLRISVWHYSPLLSSLSSRRWVWRYYRVSNPVGSYCRYRRGLDLRSSRLLRRR